MNDARTLRIVVAVALVLGAALFAFGVVKERSSAEATAASVPHEEGSEQSEAGEGEEPSAHTESDAELLGVDLESTPFVVLVLIGSAALAAAVVLARSRALLAVTALVALGFAAADTREIFTQLDEENTGIAVIAGIVLALHVVAAVAAFAAWRRFPPIETEPA
jgi:hypothetical protein